MMYKIYKKHQIYLAKKKIYAEKVFNYFLLDIDWLEQEQLEEQLLMKKLKEINIDSLHGVTDVVELVIGEKPLEQMKLSRLYEHEQTHTSPNTKSYEWVYRTLSKFGNVFVNKNTFDKLDLKRLGRFSKTITKSEFKNEVDGYVLWRLS